MPSAPNPNAIPPSTLESGNLQQPTCDLTRYGSHTPVKTPPIVYVRDFGAVGDGQTDDSDAIKRAIQSLSSGGTVVFDSGKTYLKRKLITVKKSGVKLWGYGSTIYSYVAADQLRVPERGAQVAFFLAAPDTAAYGMTIVTNMRKRPLGLPGYAGIFLTSTRQEAIDNRFEYTANGVITQGATNFLIARNVVYRTTADGIHMTTGSTGGHVACNVVRENGDDMVAVVDYGNGEPQMSDFLIEDNDLAGNYWGRGITVSGGRDVTIRRNKIALTSNAAAIYMVSEESFKTRNIRNVLIEDNQILNSQNTTPAYNPINNFRRGSHGAIEVAGEGDRRVADVLFRRNSIDGAGFDAIRTRGNVCGIGFSLTEIANVRFAPINLENLPDDQCTALVACSGVRYRGADVVNGRCSNNPLPAVTGSPQS